MRDGNAVGHFQLAEESRLGGAHPQRVVIFRNGDLHSLLAAFRAIQRGVDEADHASGGGVEAQGIDAGGYRRQTDADDQRHDPDYHDHFDERNTGFWLLVSGFWFGNEKRFSSSS